jgi:transcriptional regulator with XRE-family HTH domain
MELGKKIKELRTKQGLTQNELAEKVFVSYQAVSQWENGTTNPDINTIVNNAKTYV